MIYRKRWLDAVRYLIQYYSGEKEYQLCPLCRIAEDVREKNHKKDTCECCLWVIFEKQECQEYLYERFPRLAKKYKHVAFVRKERPRIWVKDSLKRLKRWERLLKNSEE